MLWHLQYDCVLYNYYINITEYATQFGYIRFT